MAGKGDRFRPVDQKVYGENYDRIFGDQKHAPAPNDQTPDIAAGYAAPEGDYLPEQDVQRRAEEGK